MNHQYTIGTVARLSGFSPHQLRKWESRLGLLVPDRAANGRRVYSEKQIERLKMLRRLINTGYRIGDLAKMGEDHWYTLDPDSGENADYREIRALISGKMICAVLDANREDVPNFLKLQLSKNRLNCNVLEVIADVDVLVAELAIISKNEVKILLEAQRRGVNILIVFRSCDSESLKELIGSGIVCMKAPVPPNTLIQQIKAFAKTRRERSAEAIPQRRFSDAALSRAAAMSETIKCECPQHIASLILDISRFEEYSLSCQNQSPDDQALHAELRLVAAQARYLFEGALKQVAEAEGLELSEGRH